MDAQLGEFINQNFVSIKLNGKKGEGPELKKKLEVQGYPTIVFLDTEGNEIDRVFGWDGDTDNFKTTLENFLAGKGTLKSMLAAIEQKPDDLELNFQLAEKYRSRWQADKAAPYFKKVLQLDPQNSKGYAEKATCCIALDRLWSEKEPLALQDFLKSAKDKSLLKEGYSALVRFYNKQKDSLNTLQAYDSYLSAFSEDTSVLNGYAWYIYEERLEEKYPQGIAMAKKALQIDPQAAGIWDTLAWLYFEAGQIDEAEKAMLEAKKLEPDNKSFDENLVKIRAAKKV